MKIFILKFSMSIIFFIYSLNVISQTNEQRNLISQSYNLTDLNQLYIDFNNEYQNQFELGLQFLIENDLEIEGLEVDNSYFYLRGYDESINNVIYYKSLNNTPTKSSIQTARVQKLHNGNAVGVALEGMNMILGIWDAGYPLRDHKNLGNSRTIIKDNANSNSFNQSGINHATHVSGTMIGNGTFKFTAKGIAPKANLWVNFWDNDIAEMTLEASEGLLVSNHSYSINNRSYVNLPGVFGRYNAFSEAIDLLTYKADMYLPVLAAGNDREGIYSGGQLIKLNPAKQGFDLMTNEMVSKNAVVVAAVEGISAYELNTDGTNNVVMSSFSQWGPTDDFRVKPDISAKGVNVYSSSGYGINVYSFLSGTSMAAPSVSAVFILWQNYHNYLWPTANNQSGFMKAASLKALMAHTASPTGEAEGPNPKFGWGLINAEGGVMILNKAKNNKAVFKELTISNNQEHSFLITSDGSEPITATIAWTDSAAEPVQSSDSTQSILVNDLDLRIIKIDTNEVILPWVLNKSWSNIFAYRGDNNVDPIEKITYYSPLTGKASMGVYKVVVTHKNELVASQNFSILVSGGITEFDHTVDREEFTKEDLKLFPNPASDYLSITNLNFDTIEFYDVSGKLLSLVISEGEYFNVINVEDLSKGVYFISLTKGKTTLSIPFVKK